MQLKKIFAIASSLVVGISMSTAQIAQAVQLSDGVVYFVEPPSLGSVTTTYNAVDVLQPTYYFTIDIPENAGEPLKKVVINQIEGVDHPLGNLADVYATIGSRKDKKVRQTIEPLVKDPNKRTVSVIFNPPVSPGQKITIALIPVSNPDVSGVYLFGVTAFPTGEKSHGQFLGVGRLQFYSSGQF
jgi:hypothetical protein